MRASWWAMITGGLLAATVPLAGQGRGAGGTAAEARRVTLDLGEATMREALREIVAQSGVSLAYDSRTVPLDRRVSLRVTGATAVEALRAVLRGFPVDVQATGGRVLLVRRADQPPPALLPPDGALSGRVTDAATGAPVPGAVVVVDGGRLRATANAAGEYRLPAVPAGVRVLTARRIGYAPAERAVTVPEGGAVTLDFALGAVASRLDEVVTTVTGAQRRLEVGNAIGRIAADSLVGHAPITSFTDLVNARVPGAQVVAAGGVTGGSPRIRIRGLNSFTVGNDPLLVVDGARMESGTAGIDAFGITAGRLNDINPEEIESIEVVKGPSATTLYGTDAANGVIVIRTKRGQRGRAQWTAYAEGGVIAQPAEYPDSYHSWGRDVATDAVQQCTLPLAAAGSCVIDSLTTFNPLMNGATSPIARGGRGQYGLQVSGGAAQFTYFGSGEYEHETGFLRMPSLEAARVGAERGGVSLPDEQLRPNALRRTSGRFNLGTHLGERGDVSLSTGLVESEVRIPSPTLIGSGLSGRGYHDAQDGWASTRPGEAFAVRHREAITRYTSSLNASWLAFPWLSTRATIGVDHSSTRLDALQRRGEGPLGTFRTGRRLDARTNVGQYSADVSASALFMPRPRLSSRSSVGVQYNRRLVHVTSATGTNLLPGAETVAGAAVLTGSEQTVATVVAGGYAEQTVGLDERMYITVAVRADGASAFGRAFRTAVYPKASASWLAVQGRAGPLSTLRLRAAYGASGVMPDATAAMAQMTLAPALVDGVATTGAVTGAIGNPDLRPERQAELETGMDVELLGGRVRVEGTFYDRLSHDALVNRPLPAEVGVASRQENIGAVRNRGVEGLVAATLVQRAAVRWDVEASGSVNRNRVERLAADVPFVGNVFTRSEVGYPIFSRFELPILGFDDTNGNGIIEAGEVQVGDTRVYLGQTTPPRQLTLSSALAFLDGRVRVSTQFDYRGGHVLFNGFESGRCNAGIGNCRAANDPSVPLADQAAAVARNLPAPFQTLAGYMEDASFLRWRELTLTYTAPDHVARLLRAHGASVTLTGRNLALFTDYRGADPEVGNPATATRQEGVAEGSSYPPARYWLLRLSLDY